MESGHHEHHEHAEHIHKVHVERKRHSLRANPWVVSTIVLVLLVILLLILNIFGKGGVSVKNISADKAGEKLLNFATNLGYDAEVKSVEEQGSFYLVTLSIEGEDLPMYVTKDGQYFANALYPLEAENNTNTNTNTNTQTTEVPKTAKPSVELFVMSYCPYGTQAEKGILPVVDLLGDKIDFNLRFVYYAMHPSQGEVEENLRQYCIQKEQESKFNAYLTCFLKAGDNSTCLTEAKIDKTKLSSCMTAADKQFQISANKNDKTKWLNGNYPLFNIDKELNELYNVGGSPTLVINGVTVNSARSPAAYLTSICGAFSDGNVPDECSEQLSTTVYSAGFGYTTTTSNSAAECG
ncbi:MAG: hypothetical protein ACP5NZ_02935 [Nanobdellota archaeon]